MFAYVCVYTHVLWFYLTWKMRFTSVRFTSLIPQEKKSETKYGSSRLCFLSSLRVSHVYLPSWTSMGSHPLVSPGRTYGRSQVIRLITSLNRRLWRSKNAFEVPRQVTGMPGNESGVLLVGSTSYSSNIVTWGQLCGHSFQPSCSFDEEILL